MRTLYEAYDGTIFDNLEDAFNYDWLNKFPNIRLYDIDGTALSSIDEAESSFVARVETAEEKKFVVDYLRICYGDIWFYEHWQNLHNGATGYILDTEDELCYMSHDAVVAYFQNDLDPESALADVLEIEKA